MRNPGWTRRRLLQRSAVAVAACPFASMAQALPTNEGGPEIIAPGSIAYATPHTASDDHPAALYVLQKQHNGWRQLQRRTAEAPAAAALDATAEHLYVAHSVGQKHGLPAGRVEVYRVDRASGRLQLHGEQRLALAATHPLAVALSPQQDLLVVASEGGVVSLFPVLPQGRLEAVSAAHKQLSVAMAPRQIPSMRFLESGELAVTLGGTVRRFACTTQGMELTGIVERAPAIAVSAPPPALQGFSHLRCLAIANLETTT